MAPVRRLLTFTIAIGATLAAVPASPASAVETCRGEAATIVGSEGATVTGTEGRDVVVTNSALIVNTLGGDDVVCITGGTFSDGAFRSVRLSTGPGADIVDGTAAGGWAAEAVLGEGSDRFYGGPQTDRVTAGTVSPDFVTTYDTEPDTIVTGSGDDSVSSGDASAANLDSIDLGAGNDGVVWRGRGAATAGSVSAGEGRDYLSTVVGDGTLRLDNVAGLGTQVGLPVLAWSGLEDFFVARTGPAPAGIEVVGGSADEEVTVSGHGDAGPLGVIDVDLGAGDDTFRSDAPGLPGSVYAGGQGRDLLMIGSADSALALDLRKGTLDVDVTARAAVSGVEDAHLLARTVSIRGTDQANSLTTTGCRQTLVGRRGPDVLRSSYDGYFERFTFDCTQRAHFSGGRGHDQLRGSLGPDRLIGNTGRDRAEGRGGNDLCRAEKRTKCERR